MTKKTIKIVTALWSRDAITGLMDRLDGSMTDRKLISDWIPIAIFFFARIGSGAVPTDSSRWVINVVVATEQSKINKCRVLTEHNRGEMNVEHVDRLTLETPKDNKRKTFFFRIKLYTKKKLQYIWSEFRFSKRVRKSTQNAIVACSWILMFLNPSSIDILIIFYRYLRQNQTSSV